MPISPLNVAAREFIRDVRAGAFERANAALPTLVGRRDETLRRSVADLHAHRHEWAKAAEALDGVNDAGVRLHRNLYRNMAALKKHRPTVYRQLLAELNRPACRYRPVVLPCGKATVAVVEGDRTTPIHLDPAAQIAVAAAQIDPICADGKSLAFCSVHDGHVFGDIASRPPTLSLGRQQPLCVIEPDVSLLLANLMAHDWSAPLGPIVQPRIAWYVGPAWFEAMRLDSLTDRYFIFPSVNIKQGPAGRAIEDALVPLIETLGEADLALAKQAAAYYAGRTPTDHADALAGRSGRAARVLLLTTRFSTVLQHSTRDAEDAFRRLGCETMLVIEPSPFSGITRMTLRRATAEFKPDVVFQIDHHRYEHKDAFPPGLPFVNWIQDLLPHLMTVDAGRRLGPADFVLTPSTQRWTGPYAYPPRQCMEFRKLTRVPHRPLGWKSDDRRVVYVSNWSQRPEQTRDELLAGADELTQRVIAGACDRMTAVYARGDALPTTGHVRRVVERSLADLGLTAPDALIVATSIRLFDRMNNLLYRQQGLAWAAAACDALGLRLEIYGDGWDQHPTLARFARGPVAYGDDLESLTRSAGVNLVLEPFVCIAHQRVLDACVAGGFCLLRGNPPTIGLQRMIDLVAGRDVEDSQTLAGKLDADGRRKLAVLLAACAEQDAAASSVDPIATTTALQRAGFLPATGPILPHLDAVSFDTPDGLIQRLERFTRDPSLRSEIAHAQRDAVAARYGYAAGLRRMLSFVVLRLEEQSPAIRRAA